MQIYYLTMLIISVLATLVFVWKSSSNTDVYFSLIFAIIPIADLGYVAMSVSKNTEEILLANKIVYIGGCFLSLFIVMSIISMYSLSVHKAFTIFMFGSSFIVYALIFTAGFNSAYYKSVDFEIIDGVPTLVKEYGPVHALFYVFVITHALIGISVIIYCSMKKEGVSIRTLVLFSLAELFSICSYFGTKVFHLNFEIVPVSYIFFQIVFLLIMDRTEMYYIGRNQAAAVFSMGECGFMSADKNLRFLGCNDMQKKIFPGFVGLRVDSQLKQKTQDAEVSEMTGYITEFIAAYEKDNSITSNEHIVEKNDRIYRLLVEHLIINGRIKGYQISTIDETQQRRYTRLLEDYNVKLEEEVEEKTEHIQEIQDKMVLGLATMVESRDASTGGHIKRTSHVVGILIAAMRKDKLPGLDDEFCKCVVKAAPMHDIGKIAVDDKILRKPGRFEDWEYEIMKTHAAKGAVIVKDVLADIEEPRFQQIAENVAHYHHERWDGSGYPEGISGEQIPLEARIMAVADVYDALVSKRCYKDRMSFEQAYQIIEDGMGKHFDASLNKYFVECRAKLEAYYAAEGE